jgi:hypothetical protein
MMVCPSWVYNHHYIAAKKSDDSITSPCFVCFTSADDLLAGATVGDSHGACGGGFYYDYPSYLDLRHFPACYYSGWDVNRGVDVPFIALPSYTPNFQFIQTGLDEFWWKPNVDAYGAAQIIGRGFGVDHILVNNWAIATAAVSISTVYPAWGDDGTPRNLSDPDLTGTNIESMTVEVTFSDGSTASGEQFILQSVTPGSSATASDTKGAASANVSLTLDPAVLIPDKIQISFSKYWPYDGLYDPDTGLHT